MSEDKSRKIINDAVKAGIEAGIGSKDMEEQVKGVGEINKEKNKEHTK